MKKGFILFILSVFVFMSVASATMIYIDPAEIKNVNVGNTFDVDINVKEVEDLYAYELKLGYDTDILDVDNIASSTFLNEPTNEIKKMIDEENGFLWYAETSINPAEPKSGSGTLATVTFKVKDSGTSSLDLYETQLVDSNAEVIEHSVNDGVFDNRGFGVSTQISMIVLIVLVLVVLLLFLRKKPKKKSKK